MKEIKDWTQVEAILGNLIALTGIIALADHFIFSNPMPYTGWIFYILVGQFLFLIYIVVTAQHKFETLHKQMVEDQVEYGLETAENLKTNLQWEDD